LSGWERERRILQRQRSEDTEMGKEKGGGRNRIRGNRHRDKE